MPGARTLGYLLLGCASCSPQVVNAVDDLPFHDAGIDSGRADGGGGSGGDTEVDAGGGSSGSGGSSEGGTAGIAGDGGGSEAGAAGTEATLRGDALIHRYSFGGAGTQVLDAKGAAHGAVIGAQLAKGSVHLAGTAMANQYVDLPDGLISGLSDATFEAWVNWDGGEVWQRVFDFGEDETGNEDARSVGRSYLFLSPHGGDDFVRAVYKNPDIAEVILDVKPALGVNVPSHVAVVFDDTHDSMLLYVNGVLGGSVNVAGKLSQIHDVNDWLGRSQFVVDAPYTGFIDEFRIYDAALSPAEIKKSFDSGPDVVFPDP